MSDDDITPAEPKKPRNKWQQTFGAIEDVKCPNELLPADAEAQGIHGFIYSVTLRFPKAGLAPKFYIGSKTFRAGWRTYRTSSDEVKRIIEDTQKGLGGPEIELEILEYVNSAWMLHVREDAWITSIKSRFGDRCFNRATSSGAKLTNGRNKWAKPRRERFGGASTYEVG